MRFAGGVDKDPRTYNSPSSAETSCVVVGEGPLPQHYISVFERSEQGADGAVHTLSPLSEHVDPLTYPLLHVAATLGHSIALRGKPPAHAPAATASHISTCDFYAHRCKQRYAAGDNIVGLPHAGGRLFQQYMCDLYAKVESERLRWVVNNQSLLRRETLPARSCRLSGNSRRRLRNA